MRLTLDFPDDLAPRIIDALCARGGYETNKLEDETRPQFSKRMIIKFVKETVKGQEQLAAEVQRQAEIAAIQAEIAAAEQRKKDALAQIEAETETLDIT